MAITSTATDRTAALEEIHVAGNVRALDADHVHALAGSIRLQGMLVPVVVRPADGDVALGAWKFELVAGFHRVAAAAELRLQEIPIVIREANRPRPFHRTKRLAVEAPGGGRDPPRCSHPTGAWGRGSALPPGRGPPE
jgi:hypothetical protein